MLSIRLVLALACLVLSGHAEAARCEAEDFESKVNGQDECVVLATFGQQRTEVPRTMIVWLHGDHSGGGPATSHVKPAREAATRFAADGVLAIAMWRPGYEDTQGRASGGDLNGRSDHYTKSNMAIVADAIARLQAHWKPRRTVLVGHSGGAATIAIELGMHPELADAALLLSCPCDLRAWRARRSWWPRSEDPMRWADNVQKPVQVIALTGTADDNTSPALGKSYVDALAARGINAHFRGVEGATHNSILNEAAVFEALADLVK